MSDFISNLELIRSNLRPLPKKKDEIINGIRGRIIIPLSKEQKEDIINLRKESGAKAFKLETEPEHVNESKLFQSQEANDGFQQAEDELDKGNIYNNFTEAIAKEEQDKIIKKLAQEEQDKIRKEEQERQKKHEEQERQEIQKKYDKMLANDVEKWKKGVVQREKDKQEYIRNSRTMAQTHADHRSRANQIFVLSGKTDGVDEKRRVAEMTHNAMSGNNKHLYHTRWDDR